MSHNIVLITIDCLRADHLSCFCYHRKTTPNIDELAKRGVLFSTAISNGPYTAMSFPSILTSTYALMYPRFKENGLLLTGERTSIAEVLKRNGYATAAFHSNPLLATYFGYRRGFDVFEDHIGKSKSEGFVSKVKRKIKQKHTRERGFYKILRTADSFFSRKKMEVEMFLGKEVPYQKADVINHEALEWVSKNRKGFFLWIHYMDVHAPYLPTKPLSLFKRVYATRLALRAWYPRFKGVVSSSDLGVLIELYDKEIKYVDYELGVFFEKLKELGIWLDNTFIVVTSDHGDEFMEHGELGHGPLTARLKLYDELLRVPLIIAGPELPHKKVENQVSLLDVAPTIVDLADLGKMTAFLGQSLVTQMTSQFTEEKGVISEYQWKKERGYAYRTKNWKYILTLNHESRSELYNLQKDPTERKNIANQRPSETKKFKRIIERHISMEESTASATLIEKRRIQRRVKKIRRKTNTRTY